MRIEVTRSGGFAGLTRTWSLEVSRTEAEQRWLPLAEAEASSTRADAPGGTSAGGGGSEPTAPGGQRDRFTYRIAIGYTEVHLPESRLEDPWRELIDRARAAPPAPGAPTTPGAGGFQAASTLGEPGEPGATGGTDTGQTDADPGKPQELL